MVLSARVQPDPARAHLPGSPRGYREKAPADPASDVPREQAEVGYLDVAPLVHIQLEVASHGLPLMGDPHLHVGQRKSFEPLRVGPLAPIGPVVVPPNRAIEVPAQFDVRDILPFHRDLYRVPGRRTQLSLGHHLEVVGSLGQGEKGSARGFARFRAGVRWLYGGR